MTPHATLSFAVACAIALLGAVPAAGKDGDGTATLVSSDGKVTVGGASQVDGAAIAPGSAVSTGEGAHAEVKLGDAALSLAPHTLFHPFGKPKAKKLVISDSTLVSGVVRIATQKPIAIDTPAGKIVFAASTQAKLHVEGGATRLSVHAGSAKAGGATIAEGYGVRLGKGKAKKLPAAPTWTVLPKPTVVTLGDAPASVTGIASGVATKWHLQVAMDGAFTELLTDAQLDAKSTTLVMEQKLPPGRFHVRLAALDADGLEGAWSAVATTQITSKAK